MGCDLRLEWDTLDIWVILFCSMLFCSVGEKKRKQNREGKFLSIIDPASHPSIFHSKNHLYVDEEPLLFSPQ